jgi:hypothetical protein
MLKPFFGQSSADKVAYAARLEGWEWAVEGETGASRQKTGDGG